MTAAPVRTLFLGSGAFGLPTLDRLVGHPAIELIGIVTAPMRPAGRTGTMTPTPIGAAAPSGIPLLTPGRLRDPDALAAIAALRPEMAVLTDYGQLVPAPILDLPRGALNLHPSLLPRHRGATPIPATILAGDSETGVTLMQMDAGLDTGPIVAQAVVPVDLSAATGPALEDRLREAAADLLDRSLASWIAGELEARPQPDDGATLTRPLRREDGRLDPTLDAGRLERQVRAYQPWPGSFIETPEGRFIVWAASVDPAGSVARPGTLTETGLVTADGLLALESVQPAGGRPMSWTDYLRGRPSVLGREIMAAGR
ncbi:MAG TPA: methionyl-tRNA formyltransferase [Candidatus Saccharimonadales bacterium]|nr:methionyl-tRNA formyltransferase [Candidatus Saccharimonadales bacterium]